MGKSSTYATTTVTFTVNVVDDCVSATVLSSSFVTPQTYDIWAGSSLTLGTAAFISSDPLCPSITYSLKDSGTSTTADSIFSMAGADTKVVTSLRSKVHLYDIDLKGSISTYASDIFTF